MWVMKVGGGWTETSYRHPEMLVIEAPPEIQAACIRAGGRNRFGRPNFRFVWNPRRYAFGGGIELNWYDEHGNLKSTRPETVFVPRYDMPEGREEVWVLENWRSPEWYAEYWDSLKEVEWDGLKNYRILDPVSSHGGYEGVELAPGMAVFLRAAIRPKEIDHLPALNAHSVERIITYCLNYWAISVQNRSQKKQEIRKDEKEKVKDLYDDIIDEAAGPYLMTPYSGYGGKTRDLGSEATTKI